MIGGRRALGIAFVLVVVAGGGRDDVLVVCRDGPPSGVKADGASASAPDANSDAKQITVAARGIDREMTR